MASITYNTKVALNENQSIADENKVKADDMNEIKSVVNNNTPVGTILIYSGSSAPTGWLICDGSAISRTDYADLFDVIGTTYGNGDGSTTFNIPNLKGKIPVGCNSNDTSFDTIGETGGEKTHTLTVNEMPSHKHNGMEWLGNSQYNMSLNTGSLTTGYKINWAGGSDNNKIQTASEGGGQAHNNLQPYIVMNYIISY